jgi:DNA-binding beta-propeller fold protein YncE
MRLVPRILLLFALRLSFFFLGCSIEPVTPEEPDIDEMNNGFESRAVAEVFVTNCATSGCHTGNTPASGLGLKTHSETIIGSTDRSGGTIPNYGGDVVIPFRTTESLLYQFLLGEITPIAPHDAVNLTQDQINTIQQWLENGTKDNNGAVPFSNPSYRVYVCNQASDKISVIDGDSKVVSGIIDVDFIPTPDSPHMVKERDGFIYVTLIGSAKFLKINTSDYSIVGEVNDIIKAGMIQISPDGTKAYISRSSTSQPNFDQIVVIDLINMQKIKDILLPAPGVPHGIALTPDGSKLYVANLSLDLISIVDAVNDVYDSDIVLPQGTEPMQAAISPDGAYLYISARGTGKLLVIDTQTKTIFAEVVLRPMPMHISVASHGQTIYVGSMMANVLQVIEKDGPSWTKTREISHPGFSMLHGVDLTTDNRYLYVSSRNTDGNFDPQFVVTGEGPPGTIGIIDTQTFEVIKLIEIEEHGAGLVVEK